MDDPENSSSYYSIYTGVWTNWSRGSVFGKTLTLKRRDGDLLIAFIALFVTIVGTHFWRIVCFGLHSHFSTEITRDGIYHQRQAILRNSANGASGLIRFLQTIWAWRKHGSHLNRRITPLIILTTLFILAFGAASGFSSRVSTGVGNEVLIQTSDFGLGTGSSLSYSDYLSIAVPQYSRRTLSYSTYAQQCYTNDTTSNCNKYIKPNLLSRVNIQRNASCPFDSEMCKLADGNIFIDSGLLNFDDDFGMNLPPKHRFQYRQTTHCASIITDGYKEEIPRNGTKPAQTVYYYGESAGLNGTYEYQTDIPGFDERGNTAPAFYSIGSRWAWSQNGSIASRSDFMPIPSLLREDADMLLVFLSANQISYSTATNDPWYSATQYYGTAEDSTNINDGESKEYHRDEPASVLGCVIREQICNPRKQKCTPLSSAMDLDIKMFDIVETEEESWWLEYTMPLLLNLPPYLDEILNILGSSSLSSTFTLFGGTQAALPDDQWQQDVIRWVSIRLAGLQGSAVDVAEGPSAPELRAEMWKPKSDREKALCKRQKIISSNHTNFSIFGLAIIFAFGGLAILLSWTLEPLVYLIQRRYKLDPYARLEWCANETLQLQRLAHEELGMGRWKMCDGDVPVTEKGDGLALLDLSDLKHPKLKPRPRGWEEIDGEVVTAGKNEYKNGRNNSGSDGKRSESLSTE